MRTRKGAAPVRVVVVAASARRWCRYGACIAAFRSLVLLTRRMARRGVAGRRIGLAVSTSADVESCDGALPDHTAPRR